MTLSGNKDIDTMSVTSIDSLETIFENGTSFRLMLESGFLFSQASSNEGYSMNLDWGNISAVKVTFFVDTKSDFAKSHNLTESTYNQVLDLRNHTDQINLLKALDFSNEEGKQRRSTKTDDCHSRYFFIRTETCDYYNNNSVPMVSGLLHYETDNNEFSVPVKGHVLQPGHDCYTGQQGPTRYIKIPTDSRINNKETKKRLRKTIINSVATLCASIKVIKRK